MKVELVFVSKGKREGDYSKEVELDVLPRAGDYLRVEDVTYIVRRAAWLFTSKAAAKPSVSIVLQALAKEEIDHTGLY